MKRDKVSLLKDAINLVMTLVLTSVILLVFQGEVNKFIHGGDYKVFTMVGLGALFVVGKMVAINVDMIINITRSWLAYIGGGTKTLTTDQVLMYKRIVEEDMVSSLREVKMLRRDLLDNLHSMTEGEAMFYKTCILKDIQDLIDWFNEISSMVGYNMLNDKEGINKKRFKKMFFYYTGDGGLRGGRNRCVNLYLFLSSSMQVKEELQFIIDTVQGPLRTKVKNMQNGISKQQKVFAEYFNLQNKLESKIFVDGFIPM